MIISPDKFILMVVYIAHQLTDKPLVQLFKYSIISLHGDRWMFMKEIYSDGDINTVSVPTQYCALFYMHSLLG